MGTGLARGYAGNAAATARAFVPDPFGRGGRLYRTGDLARWRADGVVEFVGRVDDQVKIRGFRIEPGEVAAVLRTHPGVRESVVLVAGAGEQRHLVAYVTPADGVDRDALRPSPLREFLASRLPDYLIPTGFMALDRLPLNANGKVDRAALPAPERETHGPTTPPQGVTEERLADVWRRLLPADGPRGGDIGREDGFFAVGGNSLLAARLMFRIREVFDVELRMAAFYEAPTLAACAAAIDRGPVGRPGHGRRAAIGGGAVDHRPAGPQCLSRSGPTAGAGPAIRARATSHPADRRLGAVANGVPARGGLPDPPARRAGRPGPGAGRGRGHRRRR